MQLSLSYPEFGCKIQDLVNQFNEIWNRIHPDQGFEYYFPDQNFQSQYNEDHRFRMIFGFFTLLPLLLAGFGIAGLTLFVNEKRKREIGIRKVFGGSAG